MTEKENTGKEHLLDSYGPSVLATDSARVVLDLMNEERERSGIPLMQWSPILAITAYDKLEEMERQKTFAHMLPDNKPFVDIIFNGGYLARNEDGSIISAGENLSCGYDTAEQMMKAWMASPGHRDNILEKRYTEVGVAIAEVAYKDRRPCVTAVVHFGTRIISKIK